MQILFINRAVQTFHHFPEHEHPYWEILLTTAGTGYQMVGGKKISFQPRKNYLYPAPHHPQFPVRRRFFRCMYYVR